VDHAVDLVPTFLGAHDIPAEYRARPDEYVAVVIDEMIPKVAGASLAEWCDVFCERGAFTPHQSTAILTAGARAGLKPRIHADELAASGGTRVAAEVGARSADHLIFVDEDGAAALAAAAVCAVLLPITALYLKIGRYAPARMLIDRGVPVALGTDVNPGAGLSVSMPFAITLGCFAMGMTLEEALVAATLNAAWSLDRADAVGSLEPGKLMDAVLVEGDLTSLVRVGTSPLRAVIKRGKVICSR
jgi:imidazolonepropionase